MMLHMSIFQMEHPALVQGLSFSLVMEEGVVKYPAHQQKSNALLEALLLQKLCHEPGGCESAFVIGCFLTKLI